MEIVKETVASVHTEITESQYQTQVTNGKHSIIADEPPEVGGSDTGLSPFELLLSSLGSCTAITLRMYANRKQWKISKIDVDLELFKVEGGTLIKRSLRFEGELTNEQKKRLEQIADLCPVHKMLVGNMMIETTIG
jgi:putative redox protein